MNNNPPNPTPSVTEEMTEAGEDAWYQLDHRLGHDANGDYDRAIMQADLRTIYLAMRAAEQKGTDNDRGA